MGPSTFDSARQRAQSYWERDGIPEILLGLYFVVSDFPLIAPHSFAVFLLSMLVAFSLVRTPTALWLKDRITVPRGGYVGPPRISWTSGRTLFVVLVVALPFVVVFLPGFSAGLTNWLSNEGTLAFAGFQIFCLLASGILYSRYYLIPTIFTLVTTFLILWRQPADGFPWLQVAYGLGLFCVGALRLRVFLRGHPPLEHAE